MNRNIDINICLVSLHTKIYFTQLNGSNGLRFAFIVNTLTLGIICRITGRLSTDKSTDSE